MNTEEVLIALEYERRKSRMRDLGYGPQLPKEHTIDPGVPRPVSWASLCLGADGVGISVRPGESIDLAVEELMDDRPPRETYSEINMGGRSDV